MKQIKAEVKKDEIKIQIRSYNMYVFFLLWETSVLVCKLPEAISISCRPHKTSWALGELFCDFSIMVVIEYLLSACSV